MRCPEIREDLELYVLGELPSARRERIESHLAECPTCRAAEEECRLLVHEIKLGTDKAGAGPGFERTVRSVVRAEIAAQRRRLLVGRVVATVGALAAMLLIGLALWGGWHAGGGADQPVGTGPRHTMPANDRTAATALGPGPEKWQYSGARAAPASQSDGVVVRGDSMYLLRGGPSGACVVAVDTGTGLPRWQSKSHSRGYLAADQSRVFCLSSGGGRKLDVIALSAADGNELWRYSQEDSRRLQGPSRPIPIGGGRVCWTHDGTVHMLDAKTGRAIWTRAVPGQGALSAAVAKAGRLYVVTGKALHCLEAGSGRERWAQKLQDDRSGRGRPLLALAGERVYFIQTRLGMGDKLFCMDLGTRELLWTRSVPGAQCLLAGGGGVYLRGRRIMALDWETGQPLWVREAAGCGPLTRIDGLICFVDTSKGGRLVALEQRTGKEAWQIPGIRSCDAFARVGTTGYIKTHDGIVHAIALRDRRKF